MATNPTFNSCLAKQKQMVEAFASCPTPDQKYAKIIAMGRTLSPYPKVFMTDDSSVKGCQSTMYLHAECKAGKMQFIAHSEALISAGLAALLLSVYHDEPPEAVLVCPPHFLNEIGIFASLTPGRSNGLASLFQRMKQEALKHLITS